MRRHYGQHDGRKKQRVPMTAQMNVGEDDDLIAWWSGLQEGSRQGVLKAVLRRALEMPEPAYEAPPVQRVRAQEPAVHADAALIQELMRQAQELRETKALMAQQIEQQQRQLNDLISGLPSYIRQIANDLLDGTAAPEPVVTPVERVDEDTKQRRLARMKQNNW